MEVDTEDWFGTLDIKLPSNHGVFIGVRMFEANNKKRLVIWDDKCIYILLVNTEFHVSNITKVVTIANTRDVIHINSNEFLLLDKDGKLYFWKDDCSNSASAMEIDGLVDDLDSILMDIDSPTPQGLRPLLHGVLAMCSASAGTRVCLLQVAGSEVVLQLCHLVPTTDNGAAKIRAQCSVLVAGKSCKDRVGECLVRCLASGSLSVKLRRLLCPSLSLEACQIALVALASGQLMAVPLTGHATSQKPHFICAAPSSIRDVFTADSGKGSKKLYLVSNCVTTISAGSSKLEYETRHLSASTHVVCQATPSVMLISDTIHSWQASINQSQISMVPLPIHGVIAAFQVECGKLIVTTRHKKIYWIVLPVNVANIVEAIPENPEILLQEIESISNQITDTENAILLENNSLKEISLIKRLPCIKGKFKLKIKVHDSTNSNYNFEIEIVNNSGICLTSELWNINIALKGKDVNLSHSQSLSKTLRNRQIIRIIAQFKLKRIALPLALDCHLVSALPNSSTSLSQMESKEEAWPWCSLPIGSVMLDFSFFMVPISTAYNVQEYSGPDLVNEPEKRDTAFNLRLKTAVGLSRIAKILSKNCIHRSTGARRNSSCLAFKVCASKVYVKTTKNEVTISSCDNTLLLQVQTYLMDHLAKQTSQLVNIDPRILLKAESIMLALDLAEAQGGNKEREVNQLYYSLRKQVMSRLPHPS